MLPNVVYEILKRTIPLRTVVVVVSQYSRALFLDRELYNSD